MSINEQNNSVSEVENENPTLTEIEKTDENETAAPATAENGQPSAALAEEYARRDYFAARRYKRVPLILALIGLLASFFYGAGFAFSVAAIVTAAVRKAKCKSITFKWAMVIGIVGAAICIVFFGMLMAAIFVPQPIKA